MESLVIWKRIYVTLWLVVLAAALITTRPIPWLFALLGLFIGTVAGIARTRATRFRPFLGHPVNWLTFVALLVVAMAFASDMFIGAWAASLAAYFVAKFTIVLTARPRAVAIVVDGA